MLSLMNNQNGIHLKRDSKIFQDYRNLYRSQCKSIAMNYKSIDTIVEKQHLELYNIIYSEIQMPYMFSDHKNKSFENQYSYLKRRHSYLWTNINQNPIHSLILAQHNRLGKISSFHLLPKELYTIIYKYLGSYTNNDIIKYMAIASNISFYNYSD
tara:strand:- start:174 stop:638 length:465 start_codon:yes stop_codon:yes gene_type:complete